MTQDKPYFHEVWDTIKEDLTSHTLVAHNASFDISSLKAALTHYNLHTPEFTYHCTYNLTNLKLTELCDALEIGLENNN